MLVGLICGKLVFNFEDDTVHAALSRVALMLEQSSERDKPVFAAFKAAGLNPDNPLHWRALVFMFSEAHFGKARTKPQKWSPTALNGVLADYRTIKAENPGASDAQICKLLRSDPRFKRKYQHYSPDALRKLLRQARSPNANILLRHPEMNDPVLQLLRHYHEQYGLEWTSESEMYGRAIKEKLSALKLLKESQA